MSADYEEALDYLYGFVNFEHRRLDQYSPENISLERAVRLLGLLGNPQRLFPSVHIAGTKGKGSVAAMCAACLRASGLKTALYTSPHLQEFRDRIRVLSPSGADGRIGRNQLTDLVERIKIVTDEVPGVTWYELVTAIAFLHFANEGVDIAVVEVGLGGRLDASNVLTPLVSVITSISYDHTYLLGDTLAEIAIEKGGIIKPGVPVISAPQEQEALGEIERLAIQNESPLEVVGRDWEWKAPVGRQKPERAQDRGQQQIIITKAPESSLIPGHSTFTLALAGRHQQENALVSIAALNAIRHHIPSLTLDAVKEGLAEVRWPGRLQILTQGDASPTLIVDSAHNVDSAEKLLEAIQQDFEYRRLQFVLGITADKDVAGILGALLPASNLVLFTSSGHPRASDPGSLSGLAAEMGYESQLFANVSEAVKYAWQLSTVEDLICVTGSIFLVGDLLNHWEGLQSTLSAK